MKQILQSAKSGDLELAEVPAPGAHPGRLLVRNAYSVVSPGTERLMMDFARKSVLAKARSRPDLVKQVFTKLQNDGPMATYRTVMSRLDSPQPLGYSCAGIVESVGDGVDGFAPGDRVACAGAGYANHAEFISVPENLAAPVPDGVPLEEAAFATIGAIAMQGIRVAAPTLGEVVAVVGLGLVGQLTVQMLRASGCRVLAIDVNGDRVTAAKALGAEWAYTNDELPETWRDVATQGYGADFAVVTAAASTSAPIQLAADLCRMKGRVVLVGMMPMELDRRTFYDKELELRMSTSYGPGRYDRSFEEIGLDYPLPYVRWTENRNLRSFLALAESRSIEPGALDTRIVPFAEATAEYEALASGTSRNLAVVFRYPEEAPLVRAQAATKPGTVKKDGELGISLIGAGNYAKGMLLPALSRQGRLSLRQVVTSTGPSARHTADRFGFAGCGTETALALADETDLVIVATRHDSHASLATEALRAGKSVWAEKPLALHRAELDEVLDAERTSPGMLVVGFNRRYSRHTRIIRDTFHNRAGPLAIHYTIAAGATPSGTWIVDPAEGGGRIVGEGCHFIDLCSHLLGELPTSAFARRLSPDPETDDSTVILLQYPSGSVATIEYLARTQADLPKERIEVSGEGKTARCENFRTTTRTGEKPFKTLNQDKGQDSMMSEVLDRVRTGGPSPFTNEELSSVTLATFAALESIRTGVPVEIATAGLSDSLDGSA